MKKTPSITNTRLSYHRLCLRRLAGRRISTNVLVVLGLLLVAFSLLPKEAKAVGASLSAFPQTGSFTSRNTFEVSIFLNTGGNNVNAVEVNLKFDPGKLQVITPTKGVSIIGEWIFPPGFSNTKGTISLVGGFLHDGINTSEGLISTIVFEAISPGAAEVSFLDSCKVLVGEEEGNNILSSVNRGTYDILPPPFKGPKIFSETHPDQNRWYKNNSPSFNWDRIEGSEGHSYVLDDDPYGEPDNVIDSYSNSVSFENVEDGILYFHLKAKRNQVWGGTSHFKVNIDKTPPLDFNLYLESFTFDPGNNLLVYFNTVDSLSGIDHHEARISNLTDSENIIFSAWIREDSPFRFPTDNSGNYELAVRVFDKAGNFKEGRIKIRVINPFLIITSRGVQTKVIFISWWQIYFLIAAILLGLGFLIFVLIKRGREDMMVRLSKEIKEAEKEIEDVKKAEEKLRRIRTMEEKAGQEWKRLREDLDKKTPSTKNHEKNTKDHE